MPRPVCCRKISFMSNFSAFKPVGVRAVELDEVVLSHDELEAIRLADLEGLYYEDAANLMEVSRQTFGRIVETARNKIASALIEGKLLKIEGGEIRMSETRQFKCSDCENEWDVPFRTARPSQCPSCKSKNIFRSDSKSGRRGRRRVQSGQCRNQGKRK